MAGRNPGLFYCFLLLTFRRKPENICLEIMSRTYIPKNPIGDFDASVCEIFILGTIHKNANTLKADIPEWVGVSTPYQSSEMEAKQMAREIAERMSGKTFESTFIETKNCHSDSLEDFAFYVGEWVEWLDKSGGYEVL